ncbi:relaxase/mobilization nuclease domain-containing protein, partial [Staphylococcus saprophyticus]
APNHQVAVYTHTDKDHYHNHIVINSVDLETGKKYQSNKKQRELVKRENDNICHSHGLSVPEKQRETRYTQAEYEIGKEAQKGNKPIPWKEQIRMVIDQTQATNHEELNQDLLQNGMKIERITEKTITYKHLEEDKKVRGSKLGEKYDKGGLEHGYDGRIRRKEQSREQENTRETGPDRKATQSEWDNFADNTRKLEHDRRSSEAARLAHEKSIRDKEERERERKESQSLVREAKGFDLEL